MNSTDVKVTAVELYFLPVQTRVPLKFGPETLTEVTCARVRLRLTDAQGRAAWGWGETPLSVQWVWPSALPYQTRNTRLKQFCIRLAREWLQPAAMAHPLEAGHDFQERSLPRILREEKEGAGGAEEGFPWLAALVCCSPFDLALHDAYGCLQGKPVYELYSAAHLNRDLASYLSPAEGAAVSFRDRYPSDFLAARPPNQLPAWHLVGGLDRLSADELSGDEPDDGYPVLLGDWIRRDGLKCLKVKLKGTDRDWDLDRLIRVAQIGIDHGVDWLSADFNCTVHDPRYVNDILDQLRQDHPRTYGMILYVEQPFPYDLERFGIDAHSVASRKPLFLDESAHNWSLVKRGRELGWTGVALKTCKTQTGALLTMCWAKAHGMSLMVQDLSNPMLAQIPHVMLAAYTETIMGVETNSMQFYPEASRPEAVVHPGLYQRRHGEVNWATARGPGFGYQVEKISRTLPPPVFQAEL